MIFSILLMTAWIYCIYFYISKKLSAFIASKVKLNETSEDNYPYEYAPVVGLLATYPIIGKFLVLVLLIGAPIGFIIGYGDTFNYDYISGFIAISFFEILLATVDRIVSKKN